MGRLNNLPEDIMFEILSRLLTDSALECKLVCKPWRCLVCHPTFAQRHLDRLNDSNSGSKVRFIHFSPLPFPCDYRQQHLYYTEFDEDEMLLSRTKKVNFAFQNCCILGSHNGLICFITWFNEPNTSSSNRGPFYICICNPITREYLILPNCEGLYNRKGFGYSSSTNEYKVVRISYKRDDPSSGIAQVYTLGSGIGWRNLGERSINFKDIDKFHGYSGVFANGALHWVNLDDGTILAFDLTDEIFSELPAPPCRDPLIPSRVGVPIRLGVLGDFLSAKYHQDVNSCEIWLLKKTKDNCAWSWSKHISLDKFVAQSFEFAKSGRLMCVISNNIHIYDPKASCARTDMCFGMCLSRAMPHKNTLVSLRALGEKDTKTMEFGEKVSSSIVTETSKLSLA